MTPLSPAARTPNPETRALHDLILPEVGRAMALARSVGCTAEDAEDVVQESLVRFVRGRPEEIRRVGHRAWFFRAVRDAARVSVRSRSRRRKRERAAARPEALPPPDPAAGVREEIERALASLDPDDREAVRLRHLQDLEYRELAHVLGVSEGACRVRVHRAMERLRERFGDGVGALLGSLAPPPFPGADRMVEAALSAAAPATAAPAAGGTILMATAKQALTLAATAAAFAALGATGATLLRSPGVLPSPSAATGGASSPPASGVDRSRGPRRSDPGVAIPPTGGTDGPPFPLGTDLADLAVKPDEWGFLREALLRRRSGEEAPSGAPGEDGAAILEWTREPHPDATRLLWDYDGLRSRIVTGGTTRLVAAAGELTRVDLAEAAGDAAVLEFGPGRFEIDPGRGDWARLGEGRRSLEIRGAGMDRTTLVLAGGSLLRVSKDQALDHLVVRDLTLDGAWTASQFLVVEGSATAALERVRFRDWMQLGPAAPIGVFGEALIACRECVFERGGEYAYGVVLGRRVLALFRDCTFRGFRSVVATFGTGRLSGAAHFADCTFEESAVLGPGIGPRQMGDLVIRVRGGSVRVGAPSLAEKARRRIWSQDSVEEVEGVAFGPGTPGCTVGQLLAVADRVAPGAEEFVGEVAWVGGTGDGARRFGVRLVSRGTGARRFTLVSEAGTPLEEDPRDLLAVAEFPAPSALGSCPPLPAVVRQAGVFVESGACSVAFRNDPEGQAVVEVRSLPGWTSWRLRAADGTIAAEWPPQ